MKMQECCACPPSHGEVQHKRNGLHRPLTTPLSPSLYKIPLQHAKERANENLSSMQEYAEGFNTPGTGFAYNPNAVATKAHKFT